MEILRLEPGAEPWIVDFWLALPEVGLETTLDAKVSELKLDVLGSFREIAPDVLSSNIQSGYSVTFALCLYYHW